MAFFFSSLHSTAILSARASCLFVVEDLQEGEVKIAMVSQCVPIVHIYQFRCPNMYLLSVECRRLIRRQEADNWCVSFNILPRPRRFDRLINHGRDKKQDAFMFEEVTSRNDRGWCELMLVVVVEHNGWSETSRARAFFNSLNKVVVCGDGHGYGRCSCVYKRPVRGVQSIGTSLFRLTNSVDCFRKDLGEHKWGRPSIAYSLASSEDLCRAVAGINCTRLRELRKSVNNNNTSERDADGIDHFSLSDRFRLNLYGSF
ncbi:L-lactate dehydrogenase A chain [Trichinella spiralis]|uniref:L-lactate dehydrogenase A chain n=1 Tax=Trichinella spiralis TaxID=6334 RepID=A0ABR3KSB4_TRISP